TGSGSSIGVRNAPNTVEDHSVPEEPCTSSVEGRVGDHSPQHQVGGATSGSAHLRVTRGTTDLTEHVDQHLGGAHEVTGGHVGLTQDRIEAVTTRPTVRGPHKTEVGFTQERDTVTALHLVELAPQEHHLLQSILHRTGRQPGVGVITPACLVDQGGGTGRQLLRVQLLPQTPAQTLGDEQVQLGVDLGQPGTVLGDGVTVEVLQILQDPTYPVEGTCDDVGTPLHPAPQNFGVLLQTEVALGPTSMVLPLVAAMAGVGLHLRAQTGDLGILMATTPGPASLDGRRISPLLEFVTQSGGQILAGTR